MKRVSIKWIRDAAKSAYEKADSCEICGKTTELDFHHYYSLSALWKKWCLVNRIKEEDVLLVRDEFITEHHDYLYKETVTLCKEHHKMLHSIYGAMPSLATGEKQKRWVERMKCGHLESAK